MATQLEHWAEYGATRPVCINYAFVPATLPIRRAITGPGAGWQLSHATPIPGGVNAVLDITWRATSPILCGNEGVTTEFTFEQKKKRRGGETYWQRDLAEVKLTSPLKNGDAGPYTLSGTALAGMIRNVLKVATASVYAPINRRYDGAKKEALDRAEYPITSAAINAAITAAADSAVDAAAGKKPASGEARENQLQVMKKSGDWQTIAQVADRSYLPDEGEIVPLDWVNAMMGFVLGTDAERGAHHEDQWRPVWPKEIEGAFPQGIQSRIAFGFADCTCAAPDLWPGGADKALCIPGAGPKVTYHPTYLEEGDWTSGDAKLAGLKLYPVHDPDTNVKHWADQEAVFTFPENPELGRSTKPPKKSDTHLQFLKADRDNPLEFKGQVICHNLAREEFGALIWSLFLGRLPGFAAFDDDIRHNLGHLRGFGMGQLAPALDAARLSLNPSESAERQEVCGEPALKVVADCLDAFEATETAQATRVPRERLCLFKSRAYGNRLISEQFRRLKPYARPDGRAAGDAYDGLSKGLSLRALDDEIAAKPPPTDRSQA